MGGTGREREVITFRQDQTNRCQDHTKMISISVFFLKKKMFFNKYIQIIFYYYFFKLF